MPAPGLGTRLTRLFRGVDPRAIDAALAAAFTIAALWSVAGRTSDNEPFRADDSFGAALLLLQTLPIATRTRAPLWSLAVSVAAISLHIAIGYQGVPAGTFSALVILYSAASLSTTAGGLLAAAIAAAGIAVYFSTDRGDPSFLQAVTTGATYAAGWGLGMFARSRREYTEVVEERASLLEREREAEALQAVAEERTRIARELHDMVGHALNLIVIQSGGAQRVLDSRPELARESLASIEATGRRALVDMERMLGMLRDSGEDASLSPQPALEDVERLAAQVSEAGIAVDVTIEGERRALPPSVELSAYRIIQEALTNVMKHAGAASARVTITYAPGHLLVEITDTGEGAAGGNMPMDGGGRGLIGMKERVGLFGGELTAEPIRGGGFRVRARLPIEGGQG